MPIISESQQVARAFDNVECVDEIQWRGFRQRNEHSIENAARR